IPQSAIELSATRRAIEILKKQAIIRKVNGTMISPPKVKLRTLGARQNGVVRFNAVCPASRSAAAISGISVLLLFFELLCLVYTVTS
ncbi:MAG TPA: hypothetical protein VG099_19740, partial [Gemmataceae bacterium]|nr:hypothetical protein [Gemmataceae bacterium]